MTIVEQLRARKAAMSVSEVAELFSVSEDWVYRRAKKGTIPAHRLPGVVRFDPEVLARWLESREVNSRK